MYIHSCMLQLAIFFWQNNFALKKLQKDSPQKIDLRNNANFKAHCSKNIENLWEKFENKTYDDILCMRCKMKWLNNL